MKNALETLEQQILDHVREGRELPGGWTTVVWEHAGSDFSPEKVEP